jgi:hypothetical protein
MSLTERENFMRNASLAGHEWIPATVAISGGTWHQEREAVEEVCLNHPLLFPDFKKGQIDFDTFHRAENEKRVTDEWGCVWQCELDGLMGLVLESPLDDWAKFATWKPPEPKPLAPADRKWFADVYARNGVVTGALDHGFVFMRLHYLRGYVNFMLDIATGEPRLQRLLDILEAYNARRIRAYLQEGIHLLTAGDDLGTQTGSMIGPAHFRQWILPTYRRLFAPVRRAGAHVNLHSDGYILDLLDPMIESGVTIVNPQDLVNGIDNIARAVKGRVCILCDIDRQKILPFGAPAEVRELIKEEVLKLGSPAGGLEFVAGIYPPTPARNVEALCAALEEFRTYWAGRP